MTDSPVKQTADTENRHMLPEKGGEGGVMDWESGISRHTGLYRNEQTARPAV